MCLFYFNHLSFFNCFKAIHYFNNNFQDLHILVKKKKALVHYMIADMFGISIYDIF